MNIFLHQLQKQEFLIGFLFHALEYTVFLFAKKDTFLLFFWCVLLRKNKCAVCAVDFFSSDFFQLVDNGLD